MSELAESDSTAGEEAREAGLPTTPGIYLGTRGSAFMLTEAGEWFDGDGTPSAGHGNWPGDYLPLVSSRVSGIIRFDSLEWHDRAVQVATLREAAAELAERVKVPAGVIQQMQVVYDMGPKHEGANAAVIDWLRARADRLDRTEGESK